jgi:hypothetical protein
MGGAGTDKMSLEGWGQYVLNANCTDGELAVRGHFKKTDNSGGAVTIDENANFLSSVITTGIAQGPGTGNNQIQLATTASAVDGAYDPAQVFIPAGTGAGQTRNILEYDGATRTVTVDRNWKVNPSTDTEYRIVADAGRETVNEGLAQGPGSGNNTMILNALASSANNAYIGQTAFLRSGTGEDQSRLGIAYNGGTKELTVDRDWDINPDSTTGYVMLAVGNANLVSIQADTQSVTDLKDFADAGYDPSTNQIEAVKTLINPTRASTNTLYVNKLGNDGNAGTSEADDAFLTITATLAAASNGDSIGIGPGTYTEQVDMSALTGIRLFATDGAYNTVIEFNGETVLLGHGCILEDLTVNTLAADVITGTAVVGDNFNLWRLDRCIINGEFDAIQMVNTEYATISRCQLKATYDCINASAAVGAIIDNTYMFTDGTYDSGAQDARCIHNTGGTVSDSGLGGSITLNDCIMVVNTAVDNAGASGAIAVDCKDGEMVVNGGSIMVISTSATFNNTLAGVRSFDTAGLGLILGKVQLNGVKIRTAKDSASPATALDLLQTGAATLIVNGAGYDTTKTSGYHHSC